MKGTGNLQPIATTKGFKDGQPYVVTLYADVPDILRWLGGKALNSKGGRSRALSGAIIAKAKKVKP